MVADLALVDRPCAIEVVWRIRAEFSGLSNVSARANLRQSVVFVLLDACEISRTVSENCSRMGKNVQSSTPSRHENDQIGTHDNSAVDERWYELMVDLKSRTSAEQDWCQTVYLLVSHPRAFLVLPNVRLNRAITKRLSIDKQRLCSATVSPVCPVGPQRSVSVIISCNVQT